MSRLIKYNIGPFSKRLVMAEGRLAKCDAFLSEQRVGSIYLGRTVSHRENLGYFIDLGNNLKGLYQGTDVHVGKTYLFRIERIQEGKCPLVSRNIELVGNLIIYPSQKRGSSVLSNEKLKACMELPVEDVYFKAECEEASDRDILQEYKFLKEKQEEILKSEETSISIGKVFEPIFKPMGPLEGILEIEERILRYRQDRIVDEGICFHLEKTKAGLVVDVDSLGSKKDSRTINQIAISRLGDILMTMNVGGVVIVDLVGDEKGVSLVELMKDSRITYCKISPNGIMEIIRKRRGVDFYDYSLQELLAIHIQHFSEKKSFQINRRFEGVEKYLPDCNIEFTKTLHWYEEKTEGVQ